jgi:MFS family permease
MIIGANGLVSGNILLLLISLFLMGLNSAFFSPIKYSILPQLLEEEELLSANAYVEMGTFFAVLLGTLLGGPLIADPHIGSSLMGVVTITIALLGLLASMQIRPPAPAATESIGEHQSLAWKTRPVDSHHGLPTSISPGSQTGIIDCLKSAVLWVTITSASTRRAASCKTAFSKTLNDSFSAPSRAILFTGAILKRESKSVMLSHDFLAPADFLMR